MKNIPIIVSLPIIAGAIVMSGVAHAQVPPANPNPPTPAMNNPDATPTFPAAGANSFTEAQAKSRIEAAGFSDVTALAKDKDGIWRGKAMKSGASHDVALDYQGHVFPR